MDNLCYNFTVINYKIICICLDCLDNIKICIFNIKMTKIMVFSLANSLNSGI